MGKTARRARKKATGGSFASNALGVRGGGVSRPTGVANDVEAAATMDVDASAGAGDAETSGRDRDAVGEGKIMRALVAGSCVDACKAMDNALATGKRVSAGTCVKVLQLCQTRTQGETGAENVTTHGIGRDGAFERGYAVCVPRVREERDAAGSAGAHVEKRRRRSHYLGKDASLARAMTPGGVDGDLGLALLESALRGVSFESWEPGPTAVIRTQMPFTTSKAPKTKISRPRRACVGRLTVEYPSGSFRMVCDNDGRRRPVDRLPLELYAPVHAGVIPFGPSGLTEAVRHDIPHAPSVLDHKLFITE